ncbi:MAG: hypothetical protein RLZZ393_1952 [Pseudomonadota bacterium]|jgi:hypothetical protein
MAFNFSQAAAGAGGALAEVGGEMARTEIRKGAELDLARERSALEEARAARLAELQSGLRMKEADAAVPRDVEHQQRLTPVMLERERSRPYTLAPDQARYTGEPGAEPTYGPEKTPTPLTPEQARMYGAHASVYERQAAPGGLIDAQTEQTRATTGVRDAERTAIERGTRWGSQQPKPNDAQVQRNVNTALAGIDKAFKTEVDDLGRPKIDADTLPGRKEIAGLLVRGGMNPEEAVTASLGAPIPSKKEAEAAAKKDYMEHPGKGWGSSASVDVGDKSMSKEEYIKARSEEYLTRSNRQFDQWMRQHGLRRSGQQQAQPKPEAPAASPQSSLDGYQDNEVLRMPGMPDRGPDDGMQNRRIRGMINGNA